MTQSGTLKTKMPGHTSTGRGSEIAEWLLFIWNR